MRVILITGNQQRHHWLARELQRLRPRWALSVFCDGARETSPEQAKAEWKVLQPIDSRLPHAWPGKPDVVLLYGCHLIETSQFTCPVLNLHAGMSPWYRGSNTNSWALHNGEPDKVGFTIHEATDVIDGGPIVSSVRARLQADDTRHSAGARALKALSDVLPAHVEAYLSGRFTATRQDISQGTLYRRKDWTPEREAYTDQLIANGLIRRAVEGV